LKGPWESRSVLVTGCTGFLGGWVCQDLVEKGARVVGLVRDWVPQSRLLTEGVADKMALVRGSVEDLSVVERAINEYEVDTVFHLAAQTIVGIANQSPLSTFEANVKGTWNLLEACRRVERVRRIVVASSDKAYGQQEELPYTEETPLEGGFPYDVSKSCADLIAQAYYTSYSLPVSITRCANFYGGGDLNFNRLVPGTILSVLRGEAPIIRSDGTYVRDYLYIRDAANACLTLAEAMESESLWGRAFNFSSELRLTAREMVDKILGLMGRVDLEPVILNSATNEIPAQYLSSQRARDVLGWSPKYSLEESLKGTIEWYRGFYNKGEWT
jgi:CDP-glucose 4,6-dehydratase